MNCAECRDNLVAYVEGLLDGEVGGEVERHLKDCPACRAEAAEVTRLRDRLRANGRALAGGSLQAAVMARVAGERTIRLRRAAMRKRYGKVGLSVLAAAAVMGVVVLWSTMWSGTGGAAYAIEQTIEANRRLRSIHIRVEPSGQGLSEAWVELDDNGQLLQLRADFPQTEDGPKVTVWRAEKAEVWFKAKNVVAVLREKDVLAHFPGMLQAFDPIYLMESLDRAERAGEVTIETDEPSGAEQRIRLIETPHDGSGWREVYWIDPRTKLLQEKERYHLEGDEYRLVSRCEYLEYNQPIDPAVFRLDVPDDVIRVDQTTQEVGLAKGDLTDEQVSVEVVRQFFEALIADDYDKAGKLAGGVPGPKLREALARDFTYVRIVSIGTPTPHPDPRTEFLQVPCEVEIDTHGVKSVRQYTVNVRAVYNRPDRWAVGGFGQGSQ
jgi:hypothetical protein